MRPLARRARDWSTWNRPSLNRPDCVRDPRPVALTSSTLPRFVSRNEPTGIWRASVSGTK